MVLLAVCWSRWSFSRFRYKKFLAFNERLYQGRPLVIGALLKTIGQEKIFGRQQKTRWVVPNSVDTTGYTIYNLESFIGVRCFISRYKRNRENNERGSQVPALSVGLGLISQSVVLIIDSLRSNFLNSI